VSTSEIPYYTAAAADTTERMGGIMANGHLKHRIFKIQHMKQEPKKTKMFDRLKL